MPHLFKSWSSDRFSSRDSKWSEKIETLRTHLAIDLVARMILVEDLLEELMEALGSTFNLDPEFFAEHLVRAAHNRVDYIDTFTEPPTSPEAEPTYASLTWIRPVEQSPKLSEWLDHPERLLDEREVAPKRGGKPKKERGVSWLDIANETLHRVTTDNNIFRRSWSLSSAISSETDALMIDDTSSEAWTSKSSPSGIPTAWQERATVCIRSEGVVPISNKLDATETDLAELRASTQQMTPTIDAIQHWSVVSAQPSPEGLRGELLLPLFQVVRADTKAFVRVLKATLQRISKDSLDDYLMERQLAAWRRLMNDMQAELPTVRDSFHSFLSFLSGPGDDAVCKAVKDMVAELNEDIWDLQKRIDSTYAALRVDMQFSESRRSIMEAKTLTKLTELAFIFIPLSFVSSLFSMSVKELEGGVPIWTFVLTAIAMASLAYGIRWIVANDFLAESSRRALERFWAKRNVSRGARVPVITLALLTIQDVWETGGRDLFLKILLSVVLPAFLLVPVGFLWHSTGLDTGFKLSVTLLLVVSGLAAALLPSLAGLAGQSPSQSLLARFNRRFGRRSFDVNGDSGSEEGEEETESV